MDDPSEKEQNLKMADINPRALLLGKTPILLDEWQIAPKLWDTMGLLFEALCVRDLRVFADALDGQIYHFRDKYGLECDAVLHLRNGKFGLIEVKLGGDKQIEEGSTTLKSLAGKIDTDKMKAPSFLMVLTGTGKFAYRREDGVYVVPIGCLKD